MTDYKQDDTVLQTMILTQSAGFSSLPDAETGLTID